MTVETDVNILKALRPFVKDKGEMNSSITQTSTSNGSAIEARLDCSQGLPGIPGVNSVTVVRIIAGAENNN